MPLNSEEKEIFNIEEFQLKTNKAIFFRKIRERFSELGKNHFFIRDFLVTTVNSFSYKDASNDGGDFLCCAICNKKDSEFFNTGFIILYFSEKIYIKQCILEKHFNKNLKSKDITKYTTKKEFSGKSFSNLSFFGEKVWKSKRGSNGLISSRWNYHDFCDNGISNWSLLIKDKKIKECHFNNFEKVLFQYFLIKLTDSYSPLSHIENSEPNKGILTHQDDNAFFDKLLDIYKGENLKLIPKTNTKTKLIRRDDRIIFIVPGNICFSVTFSGLFFYIKMFSRKIDVLNASHAFIENHSTQSFLLGAVKIDYDPYKKDLTTAKIYQLLKAKTFSADETKEPSVKQSADYTLLKRAIDSYFIISKTALDEKEDKINENYYNPITGGIYNF